MKKKLAESGEHRLGRLVSGGHAVEVLRACNRAPVVDVKPPRPSKP